MKPSIFSQFIGAAILGASILANAPARAADRQAENWIVDFATCKPPGYPAAAVRAEHVGTTTLSILVHPDGSIGEVKVSRSSGHAELDDAVVSALSQCHFKWGAAIAPTEDIWQPMAYVWTIDAPKRAQ